MERGSFAIIRLIDANFSMIEYEGFDNVFLACHVKYS